MLTSFVLMLSSPRKDALGIQRTIVGGAASLFPEDVVYIFEGLLERRSVVDQNANS
jgi:hypothetical protein